MSAAMPGGFVASGISAGIKEGGLPDLAVIATTTPSPVPAAAVFTQNKAAAAPVQVSRRHLQMTGGRARGVVVNSGCANAATGSAGIKAAQLMADLTATALPAPTTPQEILVCSTGPIGFELPSGPLESGIPTACQELDHSAEALVRAARAIMTTDTTEKLASASLPSGSLLTGIAKGSAMLAPNMATMLAVLMTDAEVPSDVLQAALSYATDRTFNRLTTDGCTSTNDTVIAFASGTSGTAATSPDLEEAMLAVCADLAHQMAADAEGGTKVVRVVVDGAIDEESALRGARKVADANLVKCSWYGGDPNWGRVVSELGTAGIDFDPGLVAIAYGQHTVCRDGTATAHDTAAVAAYLAQTEIEVRCELKLGSGRAVVVSADLTPDYVVENMGLS